MLRLVVTLSTLALPLAALPPPLPPRPIGRPRPNRCGRSWSRSPSLPGSLPEIRPLSVALKFTDDSAVKTAADWPRRRQEILKDWHRRLGPWRP